MNALLQWLATPEWGQVVKALLHTLWQAAFIAALLGLALRHSSKPATRYRCTLGALAAVFVLGLVTWALLNRAADARESLVPAASFQSSSTPMELSKLGQSTTLIVANPTPAQTPPVSSRWSAWLALLWLTGAALMLARAGAQLAGAERLRRSCRPVEHPHLACLAAEARRAMGLARRVRIAVTDKLTSPAVVGVLVPTLMLPLTLITALTPEQIRFVLLHELAHIRRGDYLANLFQLFVEALLFFNPAAWWISRQARREREACCDALAIALSGCPEDYARTLLLVAETIGNPVPVAAPAFGGLQREPSSLYDRVQRLLTPDYRPTLRLTWRSMLTALILGFALLVLAATSTRLTVARAFQPTPIAGAGERVAARSNSAPSALSPSSTQPVEVTSGSLLFDAAARTATFSNNVVMRHGDTMVAADSMSIDLGDTAAASSSIRLPPTAGDAELATRSYKFKPDVFQANLRLKAGLPQHPTGLESLAALMRLLNDNGITVELPRNVWFKERGLMMIRANEQELKTIDRLVTELNGGLAQSEIPFPATPDPTNSLPSEPRVNIRAKFIELPLTEVASAIRDSLPWLSTNNWQNPSTILTPQEAHGVLRNLEKTPGVDLLGDLQVDTRSGRQAQIQAITLQTVVTNGKPESMAQAPTLPTTNTVSSVPGVTTVPTGPMLDVLPTFTQDGRSVELSLVARLITFLGYDNPGPMQDSQGREIPGRVTPLFHTLALTNHVSVVDGQTLVLGGLEANTTVRVANQTPVLAQLPLVGGLLRHESNETRRKALLIFVTPTLIDSTGNRIHPEQVPDRGRGPAPPGAQR